MSNLKKIRISRSKYIETSRDSAVLRLNFAEHLVGQPVMVRYYVDDTQTDVDTLLAIGIKDGMGEDCYEVVTLGGLNLVRDVTKIIPDVSALVHGEIYIWWNPDSKKWCYVYLNNDHRVVEPITGGPYVYTCIEDRRQYCFDPSDGTLVRDFDYLPKEFIKDELEYLRNELEKLKVNLDKVLERIEAQKKWLVEIDKKVFPLTPKLTCINGDIFQKGTVQSIRLRVYTEKSNVDVTKECSYTLNGRSLILDSNNEFILENLTETTTLNLIATFKPVEDLTLIGETTKIIKFGYYYYYGNVIDNWVANEANIKLLSNKTLQSDDDIDYNISLLDQKIVMACPKDLGYLKHIYDINGLDYINDYNIVELEVDRIDYYVYIKKNSTVINNFKQLFTYK